MSGSRHGLQTCRAPLRRSTGIRGLRDLVPLPRISPKRKFGVTRPRLAGSTASGRLVLTKAPRVPIHGGRWALEIATIGFTKTTAERFFASLLTFGARTLIDVRLHRESQLAGFAKVPDLAYFARVIANASYHHEPTLAPTADLLSAYRKKELTWADYERTYVALLTDRGVQQTLPRSYLRTVRSCYAVNTIVADVTGAWRSTICGNTGETSGRSISDLQLHQIPCRLSRRSLSSTWSELEGLPFGLHRL